MSDDVLSKLSPEQVAAWYHRLADFTSKMLSSKLGGVEPLSAQLLRHYLKGGGKDFTFSPPKHLKESGYVVEALLYHRSVYLTEKKARLGEATMIGTLKVYQREAWAGILPRLKGSGYPKWDLKAPLSMNYTANCEIPVQKTQLTGTPGDRDLLYGLHGFDLRTDVTVTGSFRPGSSLVEIRFTRFAAKALDYYDWSKVKKIKVPNPDHGSKSPDAVDPGSEYVQVYHTNAIRIQEKGLATPFKVASGEWEVTAPKIAGPGKVDLSRSL